MRFWSLFPTPTLNCRNCRPPLRAAEVARVAPLEKFETSAGLTPELRMYVQRPSPAFQLGWSHVVTTYEELDAVARQRRQLFEAKGWTAHDAGAPTS